MTTKNRVTETLGVIGAFVAAHPEFEPERIEGTVSTIVEFLKQQKLEITVANMEKAWTHIRETVRSKPTNKKTEAEQIADLYSYKAIIDGWSSSEMQTHMKDPEIATAVENVLTEVAKVEAAKSQQPKPAPQPKAKFTKPVRTAEEVAIEGMTSDAMKKALLDPVKARGINNTLARRNQ